jgi:TonB family protein
LAVDAETPGALAIDAITIPLYPYLARLGGIEGSIDARVTLDESCNVTSISMGSGPSQLEDAVTVALWGNGIDLRFHPCAALKVRTVDLRYVFSLEGTATNEWSPTYATISENDLLFQVKISTAPASLAELGLAKSPIREGTDEVGSSVPGQQSFSTEFSIPRYPSIARSANVQGDVTVAAKLDSQCAVSSAEAITGAPLLRDEVLDAVRHWRFPYCEAEGGNEVTLKFHFKLTNRDASLSDDWAPTRFGIVAPYEFEIETAARALIIRN